MDGEFFTLVSGTAGSMGQSTLKMGTTKKLLSTGKRFRFFFFLFFFLSFFRFFFLVVFFIRLLNL